MTFTHCPNPVCVNFDAPKQEKWFWYHGKTANKGSEVIHRYRCKECGRTFSERTFSIDYYTQKKVDYYELMMHLVSCSGIRNIGRKMEISPNMVNNRIERLACSLLPIHSNTDEYPAYRRALKSIPGFKQYLLHYHNCIIARRVKEQRRGAAWKHMRRKQEFPGRT